MFDDIFSFVNDDMMEDDLFDEDIEEETIGGINEPIWNNPNHATIEETSDPDSPYFSLSDFDGDGTPNFADHSMGDRLDTEINEESIIDEENFLNGEDYNPNSEELFNDYAEDQIEEVMKDNDLEHFDEIDDQSLTDFFHPDDNWHHQEGNDTCAIAVQTDILKDFGKEISEQELTEMARESGLYNPGNGTQPEDVGGLLSKFGIDLEKNRYGHSIEDLINAKAEGEKVIIGLDGAEIWGLPDSILDDLNVLNISSMGHAIEFKGIVENENGDKQVVIDDPGDRQGRNAKIPLSTFIDSWKDFDNFAVITDVNRGRFYG